ncbi:hypothetical protein EX30DRAFT_339037 [Ascodesmis nigricans]|uniref:Uncharacterized protein n=1 Tax=Ascodesmis nigricans TaxID=341454 RepID=A0A4S2N120_9PEZI|nr:hypothetical protein EX30DRAFT_339037 [Ascodesmis nigricans]
MRLLRPPLRGPHFFRPPLRPTPHLPPPHRLHAQHRTFADLSTAIPTAFSYLHSEWHISYLLLLPASAVVLRTLFGLPLRLYSRHASNRRAQAYPLISSIVTFRTHEIQRGLVYGKETPAQIVMRAKRIQKAVQKDIERKYGAQRWKTWLPPLGMLPVWYVSTGAVRSMAGAGRELGEKGWAEKMGDWMFAGFGGMEDSAVDAGTTTTTMADAATSSDELMATSVTGTVEVDPSITSASTEALSEAVAQASAIFPPELCATDPTFILPTLYITFYISNVAFSILTMRPTPTNSSRSGLSDIYNSLFSTRKIHSELPAVAPPTSDAPLQRVLNRGMFMMAGWMFFIACGMPKAVLMYWCASAASALAINVGLWRWVPRRKLVLGVQQRKRVKEGKQEGKLRKWVRERLEKVREVENRLEKGK